MPKRLDNCRECAVVLTDETRAPRSNLCRPCHQEAKRVTDAAQYQKHKAKRRASMKAYYEANRDREVERTRKWREANVDRMKEYRRTPDRRTAQREGQRRRTLAKHGLTPEDYDRMLVNQGGGCAICGTLNPGARTSVFHADHDHQTGAFRGLLCTNCNNGLGRFHDDPDRLDRAAQYLRRSTSATIPG